MPPPRLHTWRATGGKVGHSWSQSHISYGEYYAERFAVPMKPLIFESRFSASL